MTRIVAIFLLVLYGYISYMSGVADAKQKAKIEYFEGPEGFCLATNTPGPCK